MPVTPEWSDRHPDKNALRLDVWLQLKEQSACHRDPVGHIPNFVGADLAAARLAALPLWQQAMVIKCNPDSPQKPIRLRALQAGKRLYMAVPRLTQKHCFVELTAEELQARNIPLEQAADMRGALKYGHLVSFEEMQPLDLVVVGCVAVTQAGGRTGKGAGFADLELALLREFERVQNNTPIVTTVHPLQVVEQARLPMQPHDWPLDWIITPEAVIETHTAHDRPSGLDWQAIRPDQYESIPILRQLQAQQG